MSTSSRIAVVNEDGTVNSIYCHWDGYPSYTGNRLLSAYNTLEKATALISLGSLSLVELLLSPPPNTSHSFESPQPFVTIAYHRDRGEDLCVAKYENTEAWNKAQQEDYNYIFINGKWYFCTYGKHELKPLEVEFIYTGGKYVTKRLGRVLYG